MAAFITYPAGVTIATTVVLSLIHILISLGEVLFPHKGRRSGKARAAESPRSLRVPSSTSLFPSGGSSLPTRIAGRRLGLCWCRRRLCCRHRRRRRHRHYRHHRHHRSCNFRHPHPHFPPGGGPRSPRRSQVGKGARRGVPLWFPRCVPSFPITAGIPLVPQVFAYRCGTRSGRESACLPLWQPQRQGSHGPHPPSSLWRLPPTRAHACAVGTPLSPGSSGPWFESRHVEIQMGGVPPRTPGHL